MKIKIIELARKMSIQEYVESNDKFELVVMQTSAARWCADIGGDGSIAVGYGETPEEAVKDLCRWLHPANADGAAIALYFDADRGLSS